MQARGPGRKLLLVAGACVPAGRSSGTLAQRASYAPHHPPTHTHTRRPTSFTRCWTGCGSTPRCTTGTTGCRCGGPGCSAAQREGKGAAACQPASMRGVHANCNAPHPCALRFHTVRGLRQVAPGGLQGRAGDWRGRRVDLRPAQARPAHACGARGRAHLCPPEGTLRRQAQLRSRMHLPCPALRCAVLLAPPAGPPSPAATRRCPSRSALAGTTPRAAPTGSTRMAMARGRRQRARLGASRAAPATARHAAQQRAAGSAAPLPWTPSPPQQQAQW